MSSFLEHCDASRQKFGKNYAHVHTWLDEFFSRMGWSLKHRDIRHHLKGIEQVREMWGEEAAEAARLHIEMDFEGFIPRDEKEVQSWRMGVLQTSECEQNDCMLVVV
jgi:hypothetical protein